MSEVLFHTGNNVSFFLFNSLLMYAANTPTPPLAMRQCAEPRFVEPPRRRRCLLCTFQKRCLTNCHVVDASPHKVQRFANGAFRRVMKCLVLLKNWVRVSEGRVHVLRRDMLTRALQPRDRRSARWVSGVNPRRVRTF